MRLPIRGALTALSLIVPNAAILAQQPPATTPKAATPKAATVAPRRDPRLEAPLAIANGEKVTRREVLDFLTTQGVPPGQEAMAYDLALNSLINTRLLNAFLIAQKVPVPPREVDAELDRTLKQLQQQQGTDLESAMNQLGITKAEIRDEIEQTLRWKTYLLGRATDAVLTKYILANKDAYSGAEVTASHILIKVDPDAPTAQKDAARQKLLDLKKDIESGKTTFADAANKISEDDMVKANQNGGDLGTFQRKRPYDERFSAAAFAQKTGVLSDPVETDYGEHLILVTKRKDGKPVDPAKLLQQYKGEIINQYGLDTQTQIVADQRKTAKIEMKPMPKDLFPPAPAPTPAAAPAPANPNAPKPKAATPPANAVGSNRKRPRKKGRALATHQRGLIATRGRDSPYPVSSATLPNETTGPLIFPLALKSGTGSGGTPPVPVPPFRGRWAAWEGHPSAEGAPPLVHPK